MFKLEMQATLALFCSSTAGKGVQVPTLREIITEALAAFRVAKMGKSSRVLPLSVVDNSDFFPNRLTALETLLMLASQGAYQAPHFKQ